ncbi:MICOS complex subunit Mic10-like [Rhodnius prolixus]|uniref:MICOS complex subunit MIC10 n=1 Tax=Rhodnius prolixus TaxID=13249 RepID=T1I6D0_RHOPR
MSEYQERWEQCLIQGIKSLGVGMAIGILASSLIFRRKRWAFLLGTGYGLGMAVAGCDYELNTKEILPPCEDDNKKTGKKKK